MCFLLLMVFTVLCRCLSITLAESERGAGFASSSNAGRSNYGISNRLGRGIRDLIMVRWFLKRQIGRARSGNRNTSGTLLEPKAAAQGTETRIPG